MVEPQKIRTDVLNAINSYQLDKSLFILSKLKKRMTIFLHFTMTKVSNFLTFIKRTTYLYSFKELHIYILHKKLQISWIKIYYINYIKKLSRWPILVLFFKLLFIQFCSIYYGYFFFKKNDT